MGCWVGGSRHSKEFSCRSLPACSPEAEREERRGPHRGAHSDQKRVGAMGSALGGVSGLSLGDRLLW